MLSTRMTIEEEEDALEELEAMQHEVLWRPQQHRQNMYTNITDATQCTPCEVAGTGTVQRGRSCSSSGHDSAAEQSRPHPSRLTNVFKIGRLQSAQARISFRIYSYMEKLTPFTSADRKIEIVIPRYIRPLSHLKLKKDRRLKVSPGRCIRISRCVILLAVSIGKTRHQASAPHEAPEIAKVRAPGCPFAGVIIRFMDS